MDRLRGTLCSYYGSFQGRVDSFWVDGWTWCFSRGGITDGSGWTLRLDEDSFWGRRDG